ncbi:actin binding protein, partial [Reticulomyxa filosa]
MNFKKNSSGTPGTEDSSAPDKECAFKGCIKELENHLTKECKLSRVKCDYYEYGCHELIEPQQMASHNQVCMPDHLQIVHTELKKLQQQHPNQRSLPKSNTVPMALKVKHKVKTKNKRFHNSKTIEQLQPQSQAQKKHVDEKSHPKHTRASSEITIDITHNNNNNSNNNTDSRDHGYDHDHD